jgi:hypothetical protein
MTGLRDIAPISERVKIRDFELEIRGIDIGGIAYVLQRFPELRKSFGDPAGPELNAEAIVGLGRDVVGVVIACAAGEQGDEAAEKGAAALALGEQVDVIEVILRLTAPGGVIPFVEKVSAMMAGSEAVRFGRVLATNSQQPLKS